MLAEVNKLKPSTLILWKTDRLGRDRITLALAKKMIRDAGCSIQYVAEAIDTETPEGALFEGMLESMSEFYSKQLRQNVMRGMHYNAEKALYNGHKLLGYKVDDTKHYVEDKVTSPIVQRIFMQYADGTPLTQIANDLNNQGIKTTLGKQFNVNGLRHILFDDDETRNNIFEYFIDKIYVYNDRIVITWFYSDDKTEISLDELTEITDDSDVSECSTLTQSAPLRRSGFRMQQSWMRKFYTVSIWWKVFRNKRKAHSAILRMRL